MIESNEDYDPSVFKPFVATVAGSMKKFANASNESNVLSYDKNAKSGKIIQVEGNKQPTQAMHTVNGKDPKKPEENQSNPADALKRKGA
jgi:hypothetical protein